jgi:hypothetical protein
MKWLSYLAAIGASLDLSNFSPRVDLAPEEPPAKSGRGKRRSSPPKKRPNRLHISKRVRRKHRRARK